MTIPDKNYFHFIQNFSYSVWVYKDNKTIFANSYAPIIDKLNSASGGFELRYTESTNKIGFLLGNITGDTDGGTKVETTAILNNTWTHYMFSYNNDTRNATLYKNGVVDRSDIYSANWFSLGFTTFNILVGAPSSGSISFNGSVDDLRIYNITLNETDSTQIFNLQRAQIKNVFSDDSKDSNQILYLPFNENTGLDIHDVILNNTASASGTSWGRDDINVSISNAQLSVSNSNLIFSNEDLNWSQLNVNYTYIAQSSNRNSNFTKIIGIVLAISLVIFLLRPIIKFKLFKE